MIRVLVVAASAVVRAGIESLIHASPDLTVVGSAREFGSLLPSVEELQPDVVLVAPDGNEDVVELAEGNAGFPTVVLLTDEAGLHAAEALRAGVRAVLGHDATAGELVAAVQAAAAGLIVLHPDLVEALLPTLSPAPRPPNNVQTLTPRELEVLAMLAEGLGNKTIARRLGISEHTIKFHLGSIFSKLGVSSRTEAVTLGARQGLIML